MEANTPNRMENHRKKSKQKVYVLTTGITAVWEVMQKNTEERRYVHHEKNTEYKAENRLTVDIEGLMAMLSCGEVTAKKIADYAEARVIIGRRVLYNVDKIKRYLDAMAV